MRKSNDTKISVSRAAKGRFQELPSKYGKTENERFEALLNMAELADKILQAALDNAPPDSLKPTA